MYLVRIGANITALREFTSLCRVDSLPMKQYLLGQHLEREDNRRKLSRNQSKEQLLQQMGESFWATAFTSMLGKVQSIPAHGQIAASAHEYGEGGFNPIKDPPGTGSMYPISCCFELMRDMSDIV